MVTLKGRKEGEALESRVKVSSISMPLSPVPPSRPDAAQGDVAGGNPSCLSLSVPNAQLGAAPYAGALLKAAFVCAGIVSVSSELSLREQLLRAFGGGFELHTWSELPHGSGLGKWVHPLLHTGPVTPSASLWPPRRALPRGPGVGG